MPNTIRHKRGTTTPAAASLVTGEIAINTATGAAFTKTDAGSVVAIGGGVTTSDLGNGNATAGALVLAALQNANAPSSTNQFATEGDLNSAVTAFSAQIGVCRAWVNFNGTGTVAIRAALNVSSITDNGIGDYTVNMTTALVDTNYVVVASAAPGSNTQWRMPITHAKAVSDFTQAPTTSNFRVTWAISTGVVSDTDVPICQVAVFR